jgi:hypothetical protein
MGTTYIGEIGLKVELTKYLSIDLSGEGSIGNRESLLGMLKLKYFIQKYQPLALLAFIIKFSLVKKFKDTALYGSPVFVVITILMYIARACSH